MKENIAQNKTKFRQTLATNQGSGMLSFSAESTGLELLLNAAEACLQIILSDNGKLIYSGQWYKTERSTEILAPALQSIFVSLGLSVTQLRRIACVKGPGSFTGIRLTIATATGLRRVGQAMLAGLDYMQALATSVAVQRGLLYGKKIWVVTHAKRNLVHCQPFISYGPVIPAQPLEKVILCSTDLAVTKISEMPGHVCGSGLARYPGKFCFIDQVAGNISGDYKQELVFMPELVDPDSRAMLLLGRHADYFSEDLHPLYVRACDAVENLPELAKKHGMDAIKAVETLEQLVCSDPENDIKIQ